MTVLIESIAIKIGVSAMMLLSVCNVEGMRNTVNTRDPFAGSFGPCQVSINAAREIHPYLDAIALFQPEVSIEAAGLYLKKLQDKYGMWGGVASYNMGAGNYEKGVTNTIYVDKVKSLYYNYIGE